MKAKTKLILATAILFTDCVFFAACDKGTSAYSTFSHFGSETVWAFPQGEENGEIWNEINALAEEIEKSVSPEGGGALSRFNAAAAGERVEIDGRAYEIFSLAKRLYEETEECYNPAVGNLVDLWGFSPRCTAATYAPALPYDREFASELPDGEYLRAFRSLCDFSKVNLERADGRYYAVKPDCTAEAEGTEYAMKLDFGGLGKGYCADEAKKLIGKNAKGHLSFGGSSLVLFENPSSDDGLFDLGVLDPRGGGTLMSVKTKNVCVSTSGDYMNYYEIGGTRYCHILDPETGLPVSAANSEGGKIVSATVFCDSAAKGDALSTALMVMGRDRALAYLKERPFDVLFVCSEGEGEILYTNLPAEKYSLHREIGVVQL